MINRLSELILIYLLFMKIILDKNYKKILIYIFIYSHNYLPNISRDSKLYCYFGSEIFLIKIFYS